MLRAHRKRTERRRKVKNGKGERIGAHQGVNWKGLDSNARCDKTRQNSFLFPNEKERKLCKKKRRRGERGEGGVFDFFQRYHKLSECSCYIPVSDYGGMYFDNDVILLKSWDDIRVYPLSMGRVTRSAISNGLMVSYSAILFHIHLNISSSIIHLNGKEAYILIIIY